MSFFASTKASLSPSILSENQMKTDSKQWPSSISNLPIDSQRGDAWVPSTLMIKVYRRLYTAARGNTKTPITFLPSSEDAISVNAVLTDCIDQLIILGHITPHDGSYQQAKSTMISSEGRFLVEKLCATEYETRSGRTTSRAKTRPESVSPMRSAAHSYLPEKSRRDQMKQLIILKSNDSQLGKIEEDRMFLEKHLKKLFEEIFFHNSFTTIAEVSKVEKQYKLDLEEAVNKLAISDKKIKQLKPKLRDMKESRKREIEMRQDRIAELTDMIQSVKLKGVLERKYIEKSTKNNVKQALKRNQMSVAAVEKSLAEENAKKDSEIRSHLEIMSYLEQALARLADQKRIWTEKYYKDNEEKANQMEQLKAARSKDYEKMQELTRLYVEYEQVCLDYRLSRKRKEEHEALEAKRLASTVQLQSWWRGVMVRKGLGPYRRRKPKGAKKKGKRKGKKEKSKK